MPGRGWLFILTLLAGALVAAACNGGEEEPAATGQMLADRWLRLGEDLRTNVEVYEGEPPPQLVSLLNPDMTEETADADLLTLPVHPDGTLLGSFHIRRPQGSNLVWLIFDLAASERDAADVVSRQLDETPWQVVGGQANESLTVIRFQSTVSGDLDGTAVVQPLPDTDSFPVTVRRGDSEVTLEVARGAPVPRLEAELQEDDGALLVTRVQGGAARQAGLQEDDRVVAVGAKPVKSIGDLEQALRSLGSEQGPRSTVVYILEIRAASEAAEGPFVLPEGQQLPEHFPASFLVTDEMTVLDVTWQSQMAGRAYQATLLTKESASDVAEATRQALESEGWEIVDDRASGFATILQFADPDGQLQGGATIDAFARDDSYTSVVVQLQTSSGSPSGN
jgi:hypothetical protein